MRAKKRWQGGATTWMLAAILVVGLAILAVLVAILLRASHPTVATPTIVSTSRDSQTAATPAPKPTPAVTVSQAVPLTPVDVSAPPPASRSPIPEPGESFEKPYPAAVVQEAAPHRSSTKREPAASSATATPVLTPSPEGVIAWHEAPKHLGKRVTVEGKIVASHNTGKVCFLNFERDPKSPFYLILFKDVLDDYPSSPDKYFLNKTVRATGEVFARDDRFQIRVERKDQLVLAPDK